MNTPNFDSSSNSILEATNKKLLFIFLAFVISITSFASLSIFMIETGGIKNEMDQMDVFLFVIPVLGLTGLLASQFLFKNILNQARAAEGDLKFQQYQIAMLVKYALLEGPTLFAILAYLLSGNQIHLITAAILLAILLIQKPSLEKCREELMVTN